MDSLNLVVSFLGGGIVSAIIVQLYGWHRDRQSKKISRLEQQLQELYAPLYYLIIQSEKLFELNKRYHDAYSKEFIDKKYVTDTTTQERVSNWATETINIANQYVKQIEANNGKIQTLLDDKFAFVDPDDIEAFALFFEHHTRFHTELDDTGVLTVPHMIYDQLGEISYLKPEFIKTVKDKFLKKTKELDKLS